VTISLLFVIAVVLTEEQLHQRNMIFDDKNLRTSQHEEKIIAVISRQRLFSVKKIYNKNNCLENWFAMTFQTDIVRFCII
jgi:hypothetical protein